MPPTVILLQPLARPILEVAAGVETVLRTEPVLPVAQVLSASGGLNKGDNNAIRTH
jgi:hypothetical protein